MIKAREETVKTISEFSRMRDDLNKGFLAKQVELEALESDPPSNIIVSEEELQRQPLFKPKKLSKLK